MTVFPLDFHSDANAELLTIASRYEELAVGLGMEFLFSVESAMHRIRHFPHLYPLVWESFRRAVTPRFPFGVVYVVSTACVQVIAIYPLRSNPDDIIRLLTTRSQ